MTILEARAEIKKLVEAEFAKGNTGHKNAEAMLVWIACVIVAEEQMETLTAYDLAEMYRDGLASVENEEDAWNCIGLDEGNNPPEGGFVTIVNEVKKVLKLESLEDLEEDEDEG